MLKIRLQRLGRKGRPNYRIVLAEHSNPVQGKYIESFGHFDPLIAKDALKVDSDKIAEWVKKGATPTNTVARLLKGVGVKGMEKFIIEMKDKKVKNPKEQPEKPAAPVAEAAPAAEAPAEEAAAPAEEPAAEAAPAEEKAEEPKEGEKKEEEKKEEAPAEEPKAEESAPAEEEAKSE